MPRADVLHPNPVSFTSLPSIPGRLLLLALTVAVACPTYAADVAAAGDADVAPFCPVGVLKCPKKKDLFAQCKRNDLLDFFTPNLPPAGDRSAAPSDLSAQKVNSTDQTHYRLEGDVRLQRLDALLKSDFLTFNTETTDYQADGHVVYQDHAMLLSADHAKGTGTPSTTFMENVRYQMLEERGNGIAATANVTDPDHSKMHAGTYSTCDPSERQWEIRARDIEMDQIAHEAYVHSATVYFDDVPFFWLPYMSYPTQNQRQSGFLFPSFGYSERRGLVVGIPYYFALAPNYDLVLEPREMTKRGEMLAGQFRYLDSSTKAQIDFNYAPNDELTHSERNFLRVQETTMLSPNWGVAVNIDHVSDVNYLRDFGNSFVTTATSLLQSNAYLNGHGDWWTASVGGDAWQLTDPTLTQAFEPYRRLPRATFTAEHILVGGLEGGVNSEYVNFQKSDAVSGQRLDLYPYVAYPIETAAYFLRPELGLRYTSYDLNNLNEYVLAQPSAQPLTNRSPSRSVPIFSVDTGMTFERDTNWFGTALTQTLEPRLFYLRVPYRNQNDLPIFDTQLPSFDFPSLFRTNTFVGADRQVSANNLTAAVTTRLLDTTSGDQLLSASIGQIHYFGMQRVQLPGYPELDYSGSDYVGELNLRLNERWSLQWDQQYNPNSRVWDPTVLGLVPNEHHTDLSAISIEHRFGSEGVINVAYRFRRNFLEQVDTTALIPISARWSLIGRYYYSLMNSQLLETFVGAEYDSCCVSMRVMARHYVNVIGTDKADTALYFEFEFKGIGSTGTRTDSYLRRAMLGYP